MAARVAVVAGGRGALGSAVVSRLVADGFRVISASRSTASAASRSGATEADPSGAIDTPLSGASEVDSSDGSDRAPSGAIEMAPSGAIEVSCDLTDPADVERLAAEALRHGPWAAAVVCSGGYAGGDAHRLTDAEIAAQLELNLLGPWRLAAAAARAMVPAGTGRIVLTLGRAAVDPTPGQAGYQVAKAAAARLVEVMARELRDTGVTVNAVLPSTMDTAANRAAMAGADPARMVPVAAVAAAIAWLVGPDAASTSGALIPVYGRA